MASVESELLTIDEAAGLLRLKPSTLRAWVLAHRISFVRVGRLIRFRRSDIWALVSAGLVPAKPDSGADRARRRQ